MVPSQMTPIVKKGDPNDAIEIHGFYGMAETASAGSPFVSKVETFCRMAGLEYTGVISSPSKGPKGKIPFIKHGKEVVPDSEFILRYLLNTYGSKLQIKEATDPKVKAAATAASIVAEKWLQGAIVMYRGVEDEGWTHTYNTVVQKVAPYWMRPIAGMMFRNLLTSRSAAMGWSLHATEDIVLLCTDALESLSGLLGDGKYFGGEEPVPQDCVIFAVLDIILHDGYPQKPVKEVVEKFPNLIAYVDNIRATYYPPDKPSVFPRV